MGGENSNKLWMLNKAVYGLKDAARVWYEKVVKVISERGGQRSRLDPTLFVGKKKKRITGLMVIHVDNFYYGGEKEFYQSIIRKIKDKFKIGEEKEENFKYLGMRIENEEIKFKLDQ